MEAVVGLLLMLLVVSHGVETCDGRQDGAQCYGTLGGTVVVQLMDSASDTFRYRWSKKKPGTILSGTKNNITSNVIDNRSSFTPSDGTFRINNLSRTDGGEYTLAIFNSEGKRSEQRTLQLTIQAPVSSVLLVSECLSQGEKRVSCSSEGGDSPQYSWTLDGHTLTDAQLLSGNNETNNITLKQDVSGQLVCSVRNHISRIPTCGFIFIDCTLSNGMHISQRVLVSSNTLCIEPATTPTTITETEASTVVSSNTLCTEPTTTPTTITDTEASTVDRSLLICGVRAAVVILILIGIAVYFAWKKKKYQMAEGSAVPLKMEYQENSVVMVEMRSSASEL